VPYAITFPTNETARVRPSKEKATHTNLHHPAKRSPCEALGFPLVACASTTQTVITALVAVIHPSTRVELSCWIPLAEPWIAATSAAMTVLGRAKSMFGEKKQIKNLLVIPAERSPCGARAGTLLCMTHRPRFSNQNDFQIADLAALSFPPG
jgi:hypothetical protein